MWLCSHAIVLSDRCGDLQTTYIASHKVFCTPGMCSALKVMLWSRRVSTSGLSIFMIVLCLLVYDVYYGRVVTMKCYARIHQFVFEILTRRKIGYSSRMVISCVCQLVGHVPCIQHVP